MKPGFQKYRPFEQIQLPNRQWPNKVLDKAPIWCSVDMRDGNQALINPMNMQQKLDYFKTLVNIGFKEIEVGFPSANDMEFEICRALIEGGYIPDDVSIQVLVQAREHLIRRTFEAVRGAKNVILHFYNSTSTLQRKVVFEKDMDGVVDIAVNASKLIKELSQGDTGVENLRFEYSPESFSGTEMENAVWICERVLDELDASAENPVILNLPNTVEMCTANTYADQIEYFVTNIKGRERAIISIHPHNDRGTAVAAAELACLAGADRVEGTLFGNGERTGNLDLVTMALNMYTQGVDPKIDLHNIPALREQYEQSTGIMIHERHPYAGELVFTAFSGSHQDAINKGRAYMERSQSDYWEIPYLPIDPADVGREYEPIIRINNQSGKGGAAYIMKEYGYQIPKAMQPDFGKIVTAECDKSGTEISSERVCELFTDHYVNVSEPYSILKQKVYEDDLHNKVHFEGLMHTPDGEKSIEGLGNGPINAFVNALNNVGLNGFHFIDYSEHAISTGSDSLGVAYIILEEDEDDKARFFGVGKAHNINHAANHAVVSAINRALNAVH